MAVIKDFTATEATIAGAGVPHVIAMLQTDTANMATKLVMDWLNANPKAVVYWVLATPSIANNRKMERMIPSLPLAQAMHRKGSSLVQTRTGGYVYFRSENVDDFSDLKPDLLIVEGVDDCDAPLYDEIMLPMSRDLIKVGGVSKPLKSYWLSNLTRNMPWFDQVRKDVGLQTPTFPPDKWAYYNYL